MLLNRPRLEAGSFPAVSPASVFLPGASLHRYAPSSPGWSALCQNSAWNSNAQDGVWFTGSDSRTINSFAGGKSAPAPRAGRRINRISLAGTGGVGHGEDAGMEVNVIVADCPALGVFRAQKTWAARLPRTRRMRESAFALLFRCTISPALALVKVPCREGGLRYNRALPAGAGNRSAET